MILPGVLLIIASYYFHVTWLLYLGLLLVFSPLILIIIALIIGIIGAMIS